MIFSEFMRFLISEHPEIGDDVDLENEEFIHCKTPRELAILTHFAIPSNSHVKIVSDFDMSFSDNFLSRVKLEVIRTDGTSVLINTLTTLEAAKLYLEINRYEAQEICYHHRLVNKNTRIQPLQLGLCCIITCLQDRGIFCSRKPIIRTVQQKGIDELLRRCAENCRDLIKCIEWNASVGIRVFRMSSELIPHKSNPKIEHFELDVLQPLLSQAGRLAQEYRQRLTFHPGQYNVIGAIDDAKFLQTIRDLDYHAEVMDRMNLPPDSVMVVHGGGIYGDKQQTIRRWIQNYSRLPERIQRRLVLENCEKSFSIVDCLYMSSMTGVPVVFDIHHFECYRQLHPCEQFQAPEAYLPDVLQTWRKRGIKPKLHISEQALGKPIGSHSDIIETIPDWLLYPPEPIDLMIEAKHKEKAIFYLWQKYPFLHPDPISPINVPCKLKINTELDKQ